MTVNVLKVFDESCDICKHMSKHDRATFEGFEELKFEEINLADVMHPQQTARPITMSQVYQCLERHALNPDYTIDLPVYVFLEKTGNYKGHLQGALTVQELRDGVKTILNYQEEVT